MQVLLTKNYGKGFDSSFCTIDYGYFLYFYYMTWRWTCSWPSVSDMSPLVSQINYIYFFILCYHFSLVVRQGLWHLNVFHLIFFSEHEDSNCTASSGVAPLLSHSASKTEANPCSPLAADWRVLSRIYAGAAGVLIGCSRVSRGTQAGDSLAVFTVQRCCQLALSRQHAAISLYGVILTIEKVQIEWPWPSPVQSGLHVAGVYLINWL